MDRERGVAHLEVNRETEKSSKQLYSPFARNHIHHNNPVVARPVTVPCPFFLWLGVEALPRTAEEPSGIWGYTRRR